MLEELLSWFRAPIFLKGIFSILWLPVHWEVKFNPLPQILSPQQLSTMFPLQQNNCQINEGWSMCCRLSLAWSSQLWLCRVVTAIAPVSQKQKPKIAQLLHEEARTRVLESELFTPLLHCRVSGPHAKPFSHLNAWSRERLVTSRPPSAE